MKYTTWGFLVVLVLLLTGCQSIPIPCTILADGSVLTITTSQRIPSEILAEAGLWLGSEDVIEYQGTSISPENSLPGRNPITLILHRAKTLTVTSPDGKSSVFSTAANTIGEAFDDQGLTLSSSDVLEPSADTPILGDLTVIWHPAVDLTVSADGNRIQIRSAAKTVGAALVESSLPLMGLDYSIPPENDPLPADGQVQIIRVMEDVSLTSKSLPYGTRTELSADLEIDQQGLIQGGEAGLAVARVRTRLENGRQVSQALESESIIKPPQDQVLGIGTKIVIRTTVVDGVSIEYWRVLNLFASYYVPCGPSQPRCYYGTASGTLVRKGAVAMVYPWYLLFAGENLYIPGYGFGTVEDNNGALTNALGGTYWVDLGYSMEDVVDWTNRYVTVYFLTPVPANVADTYLLP